MKISFVIPALNEEAYLASCLKALEEEVARNGAGLKTEVLVIDNASDDATAAVAAGFAGVVVHEEPVRGVARARQRGLLVAQGEIVAYLDADTQVAPGWLPLLLSEFEDESVVCVSGPFVYYDLPPVWRALAWPYEVVVGGLMHALTGQLAVGGNFAARREALNRVGGFDISIVFYGEDLDIARRLRNVGKVRFTRKLAIPSSARRFAKQGVLYTTAVYALNFLSEAFTGRPIQIKHQDIR